MKKCCFILAFLLSLTAVTAASASNAEWLLARGQLALGEDRASRAYDIFMQARRDYPDDPRFPYLAAVASERQGRYGQALEHLRSLDEPATRELYPDLDLVMGRVLFQAGEYPEAQQRLEKHTLSHPRDAMGYLWLGETRLAMGQRTAGLDSLRRAGSPEPSLRPIYHYSLASGLFGEDAEKAIEELEAAIKADPRGPVAARAQRLIELADQKEDLQRWYHVDAGLGFQHDSNMLLSTSTDEESISGQRVILSLAAHARPEVGDNLFLGFGTRINQGQAVGISDAGLGYTTADFHYGHYTFFADAGYLMPSDGLDLEPGLEYAFHMGTLGGERHELTHNVYPRLMVYRSARNSTKAYGIFRAQQFDEVPGLAPLAHFDSGLTFGAGVGEYLVFDDRLDAMRIFAEYVVRSPSDEDGDHFHGPLAGINGRKRIVADLYADAGLFATYRLRANETVLPSELLLAGDLSLGYLLVEYLEIDLNVGYNRSFSEADFQFDRLLAGVFIRGIF